jgi:anti-anti-sigma factor
LVKLELLTANDPRFRSSADFADNKLFLKVEGEADTQSTETLGRVLEAVHAEAIRLSVSEVAVDMTKLEFLSSSGIRHFVTWLRSVVEGGAKYRIRMISSPQIAWQRRSLGAMACFAPEILTIE